MEVLGDRRPTAVGSSSPVNRRASPASPRGTTSGSTSPQRPHPTERADTARGPGHRARFAYRTNEARSWTAKSTALIEDPDRVARVAWSTPSEDPPGRPQERRHDAIWRSSSNVGVDGIPDPRRCSGEGSRRGTRRGNLRWVGMAHRHDAPAPPAHPPPRLAAGRTALDAGGPRTKTAEPARARPSRVGGSGGTLGSGGETSRLTAGPDRGSRLDPTRLPWRPSTWSRFRRTRQCQKRPTLRPVRDHAASVGSHPRAGRR